MKTRPSAPGRTDQLERGKVIAAAQRLHNAGSIRVHERLAREAKAEREFAEWERAHPEAIGIWQGRGERWALAYASLEDFAFEKGTDLLESPSFRDALALMAARRRDRYSSQGDWPERIAAGVLGKRRKGGRPRDLHDELLDCARREMADELHELLRRADRETLAGLIREQEILQYLSERYFATYPPEKAAVPPGWKEKSRLEQLARHLSALRTDRGKRGVSDYRTRATEWMNECWQSAGSRDAEKERDRLRKRKERRKPASPRT
jgi:hypothetical protein